MVSLVESKISVIIRCFNRLEYSIQCIQSVIDNTQYPNYDIIVVNNHSLDGTKEWLNWICNYSNRYSHMRSLHLEENLGDYGGLVRGFEETDSEFIVKLDNDIIVPSGWLTALHYTISTS